MQHNEYGYVCSTETEIFSDLERWLTDKKKREYRAKKQSKGKHRQDESKRKVDARPAVRRQQGTEG